MKKLTLSMLTVLIGAAVMAQNITGSIKDDQGKALPGATISLKKVKDSAVVKLGVTNQEGQFSFAGISAGKYFVAVSFVGYVPKTSPAFELSGSGDVKVPEIDITKASANELKEVAVTARKPMIEVKADKTILNVEGSINAVGQDALELLRKAPGVIVDKDDNLTLSGKNGVQVYIDGRPTPLTGADLAAYLHTIQSSSVESIEIITNPSAKYDAAGNAGIINIKLKKNKNYGANGSVTAGYNIGTFPKYNGGASLNYRNKKVNLFGNYNYNWARNETVLSLHREQLDTLFDQHSTIDQWNKTHSFKAGMDYTINKVSTVGVMVNGTLTNSDVETNSHTPITYIPTNTLDRTLVAGNTNSGHRNNINANLNYRLADAKGHELNIDADYGAYRINSDQLQPNSYFDPTGGFLSNTTYNMLAPTNIDIYSIKADWEQNFKKGKLGFGVKSSYVNSSNDFKRYNVFPNDKFLDTLGSNNFNYKENINAGYVNYNKQYKGFMVQAGLRVENTNATGHSKGFKYDGTYTSYDSTFPRNYTDFFPSAAITLNKNPMKQWSFTYSRRIDRPAYQNLNPFEFRLDEYTYQKGNTELRPQYTNSFGISNTYKYRLTTTLNYSHVKDVFSQIVDTADRSKAFLTQKNLATQDIISLNISYPFQWKWYSVFGNVNTFYSKYKANFGAGRTVDVDVYSVNVYAQQSFRLGKGWTAETSGFFTSPNVWQGTFKSRSLWSIDAGVQKTVFKGKGNIKASVSDIFKTLHWYGSSNFAGQVLQVQGHQEIPQFKMFFTYRFGNNQVKAARQRKTGTEDENKRANSSGGGIGGGGQQ